MEAAFQDRREAGRTLAIALSKYARVPGVVILGLPRGGVPVAFEVARGLEAPLDVFVVRKLGVPGEEELAMGAIASGGVRVLNASVIQMLGLNPEDVDRVAARELSELERRERELRGDRPQPAIMGRILILVDDGLATGSTMMAAVSAVRRLGPARVVVAVPVAPEDVCARMEAEVDELVCLVRPPVFWAVGVWYQNFGQTTDAEVRELLDAAARRSESPEARA